MSSVISEVICEEKFDPKDHDEKSENGARMSGKEKWDLWTAERTEYSFCKNSERIQRRQSGDRVTGRETLEGSGARMSRRKESKRVIGEAVWKIGETKVTLSETELSSGKGSGQELLWVRRTVTGRERCKAKKLRISLSNDEEEVNDDRIASADWMIMTREMSPLLRGFIAVAAVSTFCCNKRA
jgi:hypothetical protein